MVSFTNSPRARRTYARVETEGLEELSPELLHGFFEHWSRLEDEIDALQSQKKAMLENVRSRYGRHQAEAVRITMRWMMTEPGKRAEKAAFDAIAKRYVDILETEIEARQYEH
ncbi:hypothetical protein VSX64_11855 [Aurantimonas sp. C2-6-R+9]|uniref:hypothetical protein n=1 Tax=unclassified Aurantimonas TaxID=2638230 RepID=UPI002E16B6A3|nr:MULTISPECIES: hypothetical protein [unclassified Aurantimonas]MEC5291365.1 hypothetical protein [Aurantimonas sp. C2-3-R2]MEC5381571.1 hypothetical protein [Aurantimonas sp. C2-6-R+9]MEC5412452.1 hypothetical protein [Aurantimonas sp. C2-4-R8]